MLTSSFHCLHKVGVALYCSSELFRLFYLGVEGVASVYTRRDATDADKCDLDICTNNCTKNTSCREMMILVPSEVQSTIIGDDISMEMTMVEFKIPIF